MKMKRITGILICLALAALCTFALADVKIDGEHFPDDVFRDLVKQECDLNGDGILSDAEIADITGMYIGQINVTTNIASLQGIEYFTEIDTLYIQYTTLASLDVSRNKKLKELQVIYSELQSLNTDGCTALTNLWVYYNKGLEKLDVSKNKALEYLSCSCSNLTGLVLGKLPSLHTLACNFNQLTSLDVSGCTGLQNLYCYRNQLSSLDVSKCPKLTEIACGDNQLPDLDFSRNPMLTELNCEQAKVESLNVSKNTALIKLICRNNSITNLDVSANTALQEFDCYGNDLTALDISKNTALTYLDCNNNALTSLDTGNNTALKTLNCEGNELTSLNVSRNKALEKLNCCRNWDLKKLTLGTKKSLKFLTCSSARLKKLDISHAAQLNKLVKTQEPQIDGSQVTWSIDADNDGWDEASLCVDSGVDVITDATDISRGEISAVRDQAYTGKAVKPAVTVSYDGKKLVKGTDYTVSYADNKKIGTATATVTGKGKYYGKLTVTFRIVPKAVKLKSLTAGAKKLTVRWEAGSKVTGYEIQYSRDAKFSKKEKVYAGKADVKAVLKKLSAKTTYYVRIRCWKTVDGKRYYSAWSSVKSRQTK